MIEAPILQTLSEPILPNLYLLDYAGVAVFAATGALAAARENTTSSRSASSPPLRASAAAPCAT